jgi:hypothetical protein
MIPRILERLQTARPQFTWPELCDRLVPCATVLRWRARAKAGQPLLDQAGPKKKEPLNSPLLWLQIGNLRHGRRRTAGTTAAYQKCRQFISRRQLQRRVARERHQQTDGMTRIQWLKPGVAWGLDTTEYGPNKTKITPLRDLASKYQVPTPLVQPTEDGTLIALYLDHIFRKEEPPLFLKRDLGSPLNCQAVDEVLEHHRVLPLNSPPYYPGYNGSTERGMRDLKAALNRRRLQLATAIPMALEVELATHTLNHRRLRSLGGLTPCYVYHDPSRRLQLHATVRDRFFREIFGRFCQSAQRMPEQGPHSLNALWRRVVEDWLRCQGWISVRVNQQKNVSTTSSSFSSQN